MMITKYSYSSIFKEELQAFIEYTSSCGMTIETKDNALKQYDKYLVSTGHNNKTHPRELFYEYIRSKSDLKSATIRSYTDSVRSFTKYLVSVLKYEDIYIPETYPSKGKASYIPYVFSYEEIARLLSNAHKIESCNSSYPNRSILVPCVFTMFYCTGMRLGELCSLRMEDVDLDQDLIYVNYTKNYNKRVITISKSLHKECEIYLEALEKGDYTGKYFFDSGWGYDQGRIGRDFVHRTFRKLLSMSGIKHVRGKGPRVHDLRTTFCCHSLHKMSRMDIDVNLYLSYLATFMGHSSINETQYYLWLTGDTFKDTLKKMDEYTSFVNSIIDSREV